MEESRARSIIKTITWRILGSSSVFFMVYILTGDYTTSSLVFICSFIMNALLYFMHERIWTKILWGYKDDDGKRNKPAISSAQRGTNKTL